MLSFFRTISLIEGLSLVLLLFVAVPLKYQFNFPHLVPYVGMAHGLLFLLYIAVSLATSHQHNWSVLFWLLVLLCSVLPFSFIWLDRKLAALQQQCDAC